MDRSQPVSRRSWRSGPHTAPASWCPSAHRRSPAAVALLWRSRRVNVRRRLSKTPWRSRRYRADRGPVEARAIRRITGVRPGERFRPAGFFGEEPCVGFALVDLQAAIVLEQQVAEGAGERLGRCSLEKLLQYAAVLCNRVNPRTVERIEPDKEWVGFDRGRGLDRPRSALETSTWYTLVLSPKRA